MTDVKMLSVIMEDIKQVIVMLTKHTVEIEQLKKDVEPIDKLVAWRNRWVGVSMALSGIATLVGIVVALKVFY
jgi:hypothetical protein